MRRDSFVVYRSFWEAVSTADDDVKLAVWQAIYAYGFDGVEPELTGVAEMLWKAFKPQLDANNKRYNDGCKGGRPPKPVVSPKKTSGYSGAKPNDNVNDNGNGNVNVNVNANANANENGNPPAPALADIVQYVQDKGLSMDAEQFYDHYSANGWMIGIAPMTDWRAAVRNWARLEEKYG